MRLYKILQGAKQIARICFALPRKYTFLSLSLSVPPPPLSFFLSSSLYFPLCNSLIDYAFSFQFQHLSDSVCVCVIFLRSLNPMELVQELLVTASLTLILSLVVAKLVSMAMSAGSDHDSQVKSAPNVAQEIVMEDIQFSTVQSFQSERKLHQSVEEQVEEFKVEPPLHLQSEEIVEIQTGLGDQIPELPEKSPERTLEEEPQVVELPEKLTEAEIVKESLEKKEEVEESLTEKEVVAEISEETTLECSEEEDDWEGIERSELEKAFAAAAKFVAESGDKEERLVNAGSDVQLELYGLHKVATEGPCRESQPMPLKLSARAKWY